MGCGGVFELEPGHQVVTGLLDDLGTFLIYTDLRTGRIGALHPHSPTEYFLGATLMSPKPLEARLRFLKGSDGQVTALELEDAAGKVRTARRVGPARSEEITFQHEGLTFKGTLHLPPGKGPFPALVYAHGSGPATRHIGHYPGWFTQQGFAVLAFDKRGAGQSQGDWRTASFHALAGDILAGVAVLKARPDIDANRLGLFGISQGGWVGSLAASKSKDVKFFLGIVGSGVPVWENVAHECTSVMRTLGLTPAQLEEGQAFARKVFRMAAEGATPEAVQAAAAPHQGKPWLQAVWVVGLPPGNAWWTWWKLNGNIDPMEVLPKVACPVMWVLGDRDSQVPTAQSEPRIREALAKGGNKDVLVRVFPKAGHPLFACETGLRDELPSLSHVVPGYREAVTAWLKAR
jgi:dienelactone hydrolase